MIISASRRTDIPAFFSDWFYNRIKEGYVCVRNPMNVHQVSRIKLSPDVADCIVFWTKNPAPMIARLNELKDYSYYFQFTVNACGRKYEPRVPPLEQRLDTFRTLSEKIGKERVIWRYDPIFLTPEFDVDLHLKSLEHIASELKGFTEKCVFSFVDIYPTKNRTNMSGLLQREFTQPEIEYFVGALAKIAKKNDLILATCAEKIDLARYGIEHNSCIDGKLIERITGCKIKTRADGQREACQCVKCEEIGSYDTCVHGCVYCYANFKTAAAKENMKRYDVNSPMLCDNIKEDDIVTDRPVKSLKTGPLDCGGEQLTLF